MTSGESPASTQDARPLLHDFEDSQKDDLVASALSLSEDGESSRSFCEQLRPQRRLGFWTRLRMSVRRRKTGAGEGDFGDRGVRGDEKKVWKSRFRKRLCVVLPVMVLCFFGVVHILNFLLGYLPLLWDDPAASSLDWSRPSVASSDIASHLLDITHDVSPVACHSHNDYWRRVPLYDALRWGCTGVEADVWLFDQDLYVGHSTSALHKGKTFRTMYVDPLIQMLDHRNAKSKFGPSSDLKNGVFETAPEQTLVLLVDFKNDGREIFPYVSQQLQGLRERGYLSHFNGAETVTGPITVVATGNAPFDLVIANSTYRDIFFDAPLARLYAAPSTPSDSPKQDTSTQLTPRAGGQGAVGTTPTSVFDSTNSYYASAKFSRAVGFPFFHLSGHQMDLIRGQIRGAHAVGLKARYWSTPRWPIGLRHKIWRILMEEGVDYLNGDDLRGMTSLDWKKKKHWGSIVR